MTVPHRRRIGSLLTVWTAVVVLAAAMYWLQVVMPAFADMLRPLYAALGIILLVATWRWVRRRTKNYARRHDDRRNNSWDHSDRRHSPPNGSDR